jgi:hypothetical protein
VSNLTLWESVSTTDPRFTKSVNDGRHEFTTIDAYYQIQQATEKWGPYGKNWGLEAIDVQFHEDLAILRALFYYPLDNDRTGFEIGNAIKWRSKNGTQDGDFIKKLETDTITKALSRLGFNADVFTGKFDDNRYVAGVWRDLVFVDGEQVAELNKLLAASKSDLKKFNAFMGIESLGKLPKDRFEDAVRILNEKVTASKKKAPAKTPQADVKG